MGIGKLVLKGKHQNTLNKTPKKKKDKDEVKWKKGELITGAGTIVTSGTHVHGFETEFTTQLDVGDTIIVLQPTSGLTEKRLVEAVASQRSATLSAAFSVDMSGKSPYEIRKDRKELLKNARLEGKNEDQVAQNITKKINRSKNTTITYRERLTWGYKTVEEQADHELTADELLDERIKRSGNDKYC